MNSNKLVINSVSFANVFFSFTKFLILLHYIFKYIINQHLQHIFLTFLQNDHGGTWTPNLLIRSQTRYPLRHAIKVTILNSFSWLIHRETQRKCEFLIINNWVLRALLIKLEKFMIQLWLEKSPKIKLFPIDVLNGF